MPQGKHRRTGQVLAAIPRRFSESRLQPGRRLTLAPWLIATIVIVVMASVGTAGYLWLATSDCDKPDQTLTIVASVDHSSVLSELARSWQEKNQKIDGTCVGVSVVAKSSAEVAEVISGDWQQRRDGARPDVWAPDSTLWANIAMSRPPAQAVLPDQKPSIARSPVVLAIHQEMAQQLGFNSAPRNASLHDLLGRFAASQEWKALGKPNWGKVQLGFADPRTSTVSLATLLSIADTDSNTIDSPQETSDVQRAKKLATQKTVSIDDIIDGLTQADNDGKALEYVSFFPTTEREVYSYNSTNPKKILVPLYEKNTGFDADHPYMLLNANWVTSLKRKISGSFFSYISGKEGIAAYSAAGFRDSQGNPSSQITSGIGGFFAAQIRSNRSTASTEEIEYVQKKWS